MAAPVRSVSRVLGAELPTVANWIDVNWLLALFELSRIGIEFLEFHEFQTWTREVAGGEQKSSKKPRLENFKVGGLEVYDLLGKDLPTRENWLDDHWLQALFELSSQGAQFGAFRSWSQAAASSRMSIPRGLVESLPSLLVGDEALKFKSLELARYVGGLDRSRFYERKYLEEIKAHLEKHQLLYWKRLDVTITIQARLGVNGVSQRVRELYDRVNPNFQGSSCYVVEAGSSCKPWVMRCGNSIGVHGCKKTARMIAIIKRHIDPCFDPNDDSPAPLASRLSQEEYKRHILISKLNGNC